MPRKWAIQTGGGGWGNNELESYTARPQNVQVSGGNLVITAIKEDYTGSDGIPRHYTSARMQTKGLFSQQYGRFEARIKIPKGQGMWPAFWMLGNNIDTAGWPACGEIDIMENIGKEPAMVHGTLHGPGYPPEGYTAAYTLPSWRALRRLSCLYAVEWEPQQMRIYVDGNSVCDDTPAGLRRRPTGRSTASRSSAAEPGGGRRLAGQSGWDDAVSAADAGGLCEGVSETVAAQWLVAS